MKIDHHAGNWRHSSLFCDYAFILFSEMDLEGPLVSNCTNHIRLRTFIISSKILLCILVILFPIIGCHVGKLQRSSLDCVLQWFCFHKWLKGSGAQSLVCLNVMFLPWSMVLNPESRNPLSSTVSAEPRSHRGCILIKNNTTRNMV